MGQNPELLQAYYRYLFPHKLFHKWLNYGNVDKGYFENREFSFTLPGDIYIRYQSFDDVNEMEKAIMTKLPEKIDIGAVFNLKPKEHKNILIVPFRAMERELVFDIDMTDYDDVRTCCKGADICGKCWTYMIVAAKILNEALRQDFGFEHLLWVYSGRRGIHCWVADKRARKLSTDARSALAEYLTLIEGGEFKAKKVTLDSNHKLHPAIIRAEKIVNQYFDTIMENQGLLETKEQIKFMIDLCSDAELKRQLESQMYRKDVKDSVGRWKLMEAICEKHSQSKPYRSFNRATSRYFLQEMKFQICYPRLDINVTKGINHLLKTPFSVHPKTCKVCVPIDFNSIDTFDPLTVPTVSQLCSQMDEKKEDEGESNGKVKALYEKTDLNASIKVFKEFIDSVNKGELIKKSDESMQF